MSPSLASPPLPPHGQPAHDQPAQDQPAQGQPAPCASAAAALVLAVAAVGMFAAQPAGAAEVRRLRNGPVTGQSELAASEAAIADPVTWTLRVEAPQGSRVAWPALPAAVGRLQLELGGEAEDLPVAAGDGRRYWERRYRVESFYPGTHRLPELTIEVTVPARQPPAADNSAPAATTPEAVARSTSLRPEPLQLTVQSSLAGPAEPADFRDIKEAVSSPVARSASPSWRRWTLAALVLVAGLALLGSWQWWHRRQTRPTAWAGRALKRLRAAESRSPATRLAELVAVLRVYFTETEGPAVAARTASEWADPAAPSGQLDPETRRRLADLLDLHDRNRFAGATVSRADLEEAFQTAEQLFARPLASPAAAETPPAAWHAAASRNPASSSGGADVS